MTFHHKLPAQEDSEGLRHFWEKYSRKIAFWLVVAIVVLTLAIHVGHALHKLEMVPQDALYETIALASFFLIFLLLEQSLAGAEKQEIASAESVRKLELTSDKLDDLSQQVESTTGIAAYSELAVFNAKWEKLREKFPNLTLVGELPINYGEEVRSICERGSRSPSGVKDTEFVIYRSLNSFSEKEINDLLGAISLARPDLVKIYHMYGFEWGSWAMGSNDRGDETEVLLNYASPHGDALAGLHLTGRAAESFVKTVIPHIGQVGLPGVAYPPVRLVSREQVEFIVEEKVQYQKKIKEMVELGVPSEGKSAICEAMTRLLGDTHTFLDVTHLCWDEGTIEGLQDESFSKWLEANYHARDRNVTIRRIFIARRADYGHRILQEVMREMRSKKVEVFLCPLDALKEQYWEDFSLYDDEHVVYMDRARIYWSGKQKPLARRTENPDKIREYRYLFDLLIKRYVER